MKKEIKFILFISLLITILITLLIGCFHTVKHTNIKRYDETPTISEIEERSKVYIIRNWLQSGIELEFITQELISENILIYYFKVVEPERFYAFGTRTYYVKAAYRFQSTGLPFYKYWRFDRVMTSHYSEVKAVLEVENDS